MKTIYMLDDSDTEIKLADYKLHNETDCELFGTTDYNIFFNWCENRLPDIFIIDLMMPILNGYDIIKQMHEKFANINKTKIILLTGFKEPLTLKRIQKRFNINIIDKDCDSCYENISNLITNKILLEV